MPNDSILQLMYTEKNAEKYLKLPQNSEKIVRQGVVHQKVY